MFFLFRNCVATVDLHVQLDLETINARTRNSEFNPARFHGVVMRLRDPRTTALIFRSGKVICTGARNEQDSLLASKKFARIIQKLGFNVNIKSEILLILLSLQLCLLCINHLILSMLEFFHAFTACALNLFYWL